MIGKNNHLNLDSSRFPSNGEKRKQKELEDECQWGLRWQGHMCRDLMGKNIGVSNQKLSMVPAVDIR